MCHKDFIMPGDALTKRSLRGVRSAPSKGRWPPGIPAVGEGRFGAILNGHMDLRESPSMPIGASKETPRKDRQGIPGVEANGNVVRLRAARSGRAVTESDVARANKERALRNRQDRLAAWCRGTWVLVAWALAVYRLRSAIVLHVVFDAEASLAFLVAVLMPILYGKSLISGVRAALIARKRRGMRRARSQRHASDVRPFPPPRGRGSSCSTRGAPKPFRNVGEQ